MKYRRRYAACWMCGKWRPRRDLARWTIEGHRYITGHECPEGHTQRQCARTRASRRQMILERMEVGR